MEEEEIMKINRTNAKEITSRLFNQKEKATNWFKKNFITHSDWTGTYIEYSQKCDSLDYVIESFIKEMGW